LTSNKWIIGHTLGASGAMSLEMAILMLNNQKFIGIPFLEGQSAPKQLRKVLVNAVGFGGNAVSLIISRNIVS
jgi:3-oxoacyl-(acyl-carrier-protein) synthase